MLCTIKYSNKKKPRFIKLYFKELIISHDISKHILVCKLTYSKVKLKLKKASFRKRAGLSFIIFLIPSRDNPKLSDHLK